jgi:hypothetical protein
LSLWSNKKFINRSPRYYSISARRSLHSKVDNRDSVFTLLI